LKNLKYAQRNVLKMHNFQFYVMSCPEIALQQTIQHDRQKNEFRTFRMNTIFALIADVARVSEAKKIGQPLKVDRKLRFVAQKGMITNQIAEDIGC
jgi:hypothetical protein